MSSSWNRYQDRYRVYTVSAARSQAEVAECVRRELLLPLRVSRRRENVAVLGPTLGVERGSAQRPEPSRPHSVCGIKTPSALACQLPNRLRVASEHHCPPGGAEQIPRCNDKQ